jgi:Gram-negative bacterial TonB protein C-terminal
MCGPSDNPSLGKADGRLIPSHPGCGRRPNQNSKPTPPIAGITMNIKSKLALSLVLIATPLALRAFSSNEVYLEYYRSHNPELAPLAIVVPKVNSEFVGKEFTLKFNVDPSGHPRHIVSATPDADPLLVSEVANALRRWRFSPANRNGDPVIRKVELPVSIVARHQ